MSVIHAPHKPELDARQGMFLAATGGVLLIFLIRLWYLQVVSADDYLLAADKYRRSTVETLAPRGLIFDRQNNLIAGVRPELVVTAIPSEIKKKPWVIDKVAGMLGADPKKLMEKVEDATGRPYLPSPIYVGAKIDVASRIAEAGEFLPGIGVVTMPMRHYPNTRDLAHLLGYVWTPDPNDVKRFEENAWSLPAYVGKQGIEWSLEEFLTGKPGTETVEVDARRRPVRVAGRENPTPGDRLILTIDRDLQKFANEQLAEAQEKIGQNKGSAIVALDPKTGEVLCLASFPTYDTNLFRGGISRADFKALQENPANPMWNRAIAGQYSPGSTFKIITTIAAAQAGIWSPDRAVICNGYYEIGNRKVKCLGNHGAVTFRTAFTKSCNAYFSDFGLRSKRQGLIDAAEAAGLHQRTGIELRGEATGTLPTDDWIRRVQRKKPGEEIEWYPGMTVNMGIGQGEVNATPLQMANVAALVANSGVNYRPHLLKARITPDGRVDVAPEELHRVDVDPRVWSELRSAMVNVIETGTARVAQIPGIRWGGKTGSTESKGNKLTHSWFVGFAPADNPRIAIAVVLEEAGHGSDFAAPLAARVVSRFLNGAPKTPPATVDKPTAPGP